MNELEQKKILDTVEYVSVLKELVEAGEEVCLRISGNSMLPFLVHNRDDVFFHRPDRILKKGDIVFYCRDTSGKIYHFVEYRLYKYGLYIGENGMRVKSDYILREVAGEYLLIPVGEAALKTNGLISLSESGYLLYEQLKQGCEKKDLVQRLLQEYEVTEEQASADVEAFLEQMRSIDMLEVDAQ